MRNTFSEIHVDTWPTTDFVKEKTRTIEAHISVALLSNNGNAVIVGIVLFVFSGFFNEEGTINNMWETLWPIVLFGLLTVCSTSTLYPHLNNINV